MVPVEATKQPTTDISKHFPLLLKAWRTYQGLSQATVAARANMSRQIIAKYESRDRGHLPTLDSAERLARAFGINICSFLCGPPDFPSEMAVAGMTGESATVVMSAIVASGAGLVTVPYYDSPQDAEGDFFEGSPVVVSNRPPYFIRSSMAGKLPGKLAAVRINHNQMWPEIKEDDVVLAAINDGSFKIRSQRVYGGRYKDENFLRRAEIVSGELALVSPNPNYMKIVVSELQHLQIYARVMAVVSREL